MEKNKATVEISANVNDFKKNIKDANKEIKNLRSEMKLNEVQYKNTGDKTAFLEKKHELLQKSLQENAKKQEALNALLEKANKASDPKKIQELSQSLNYAKIQEANLKNSIDDTVKSLDYEKSAVGKLNNTIEEQKRNLEQLKTQYKNVALEQGKGSNEAKELKSKIDTLNSELKQNEKELRSVEDAVKDTDDQMQKSANGGWTVFKGVVSNVATDVVRKAGDGIKDFVKGSVEVGKDFENAMSQVAATMGTTVENIENLIDKALEMGATTQWTSSQAAEAMNYLALAGYSEEQIISTLPTVLDFATAGNIELANASDMVTDAMTSLGIEADKDGKNITSFGDKMARTASKSNTSVSQLGEAILTVGGTAKNLKGGTTELNTALGILADNSIKGAEGGTKLRNIILAMTPTGKKATEAWKELGVSAYDADGQMRPLQETFAELSKAMDGMSSEQKTGLIKNMFNKADLAAVNALLDTSSYRWNELSNSINNSSGAMADMAATQLDNLDGDITLLNSAVDGLKQSVFEEFEPQMRASVQFVTQEVIPAIQETFYWINQHKALLGVIASVIGVVAVALGVYNAAKAIGIALEAAEVPTLGALIAVKWAEVTANTAAAAAGMAALAPYLLIAAAIAALIAIIVLCIKHWDDIKNVISKFTSWGKQKAKDIKETVFNTANSIRTKVIGVVNSIITSVENGVNKVIRGINAIINGVNSITGVAGSVIGLNLTIPTLKEVSLPRVKLAEGGIAYKPTRALIAEAGEPEAVAPVRVLQTYIRESVESANRSFYVFDYNRMAEAMAKVKLGVEIDQREFAREVRRVR